MGAPRPQYQYVGCQTSTSYNVTNQEEVPGTSVVGDVSATGQSGSEHYPIPLPSLPPLPKRKQTDSMTASLITGSELSKEVSYSVAITVELGADLGLNFGDILSAGVSGSVSITTETGSVQGASDTCPLGLWYCSLSITPTMIRVSGFQTEIDSCRPEIDPVSKPYTISLPKLGADGSPMLSVELCTCKNAKHWADPGHVGLLCPSDCALPQAASP